MKVTAKIAIQTSNDINLFFGTMINDDPVTITFKSDMSNLLSDAEQIILYQQNNNQNFKFTVELAQKIDDVTCTFNVLDNGVETPSHEQHYINHKNEILVKRFPKEELPSYINKCNEYNSLIKGVFTKKIQNNLYQEDQQTQNVLRLLLLINQKLDNVIEHIKPKEKEIGMIRVVGVDISGYGIRFFANIQSEVGDYMLLNCVLEDSMSKLDFYVIAQVTDKIKTKDGSIFLVKYYNIDADISEEIVRHVFAKERDSLKTLKS